MGSPETPHLSGKALAAQWEAVDRAYGPDRHLLPPLPASQPIDSEELHRAQWAQLRRDYPQLSLPDAIPLGDNMVLEGDLSEEIEAAADEIVLPGAAAPRHSRFVSPAHELVPPELVVPNTLILDGQYIAACWPEGLVEAYFYRGQPARTMLGALARPILSWMVLRQPQKPLDSHRAELTLTQFADTEGVRTTWVTTRGWWRKVLNVGAAPLITVSDKKGAASVPSDAAAGMRLHVTNDWYDHYAAHVPAYAQHLLPQEHQKKSA